MLNDVLVPVFCRGFVGARSPRLPPLVSKARWNAQETRKSVCMFPHSDGTVGENKCAVLFIFPATSANQVQRETRSSFIRSFSNWRLVFELFDGGSQRNLPPGTKGGRGFDGSWHSRVLIFSRGLASLSYKYEAEFQRNRH